jgi:hypothetical protein
MRRYFFFFCGGGGGVPSDSQSSSDVVPAFCPDFFGFCIRGWLSVPLPSRAVFVAVLLAVFFATALEGRSEAWTAQNAKVSAAANVIRHNTRHDRKIE